MSGEDLFVDSLMAPHASQGGHPDLHLICKYIYIYIYIHLLKKMLYAKLTYCGYLNKNVKHPNDLRIKKF